MNGSAPEILKQNRNEYEAPETRTERQLCRAFEAALGLKKIGRNDDFFELGGDSAAALKVVKECEALGLASGDIFAGKTPKAIAALADKDVETAYADLPANATKTKLTDSQMGVLLECGMEEECSKYNVPVRLTYPRSGNMSPSAAAAAVDSVIAVHPALYAEILQEEGDFFMVRKPFPEQGICRATELGDADAGTESIDAVLAEAAARTTSPMAIGRDPLCSAEAYLTSDKIYVFLKMHHVVSDGTSVALMTGQIEAALAGIQPEPEAVDAFSLYEAERRIKSSESYEKAKNYFEQLLSGVETDSNLIADHKAVEGANPLAGRKSVLLPKAEIKAFLEKTGFTGNTFFMGVYGYVLAKMTGQTESVFGVAESGRTAGVLKNAVSMLVKTLPVVIKIDEEKSAADLLAGLQSQFTASLRNDSVGFGDLAREYGLRSDVMFVYQSDMLDNMKIFEPEETLSNLNLMVFKRKEAYELRIEYRADMYEQYTIDRFADLYKRVAEAFVSGITLKDIVLISEADRAFLDGENDAAAFEATKETVVDIFKDTVKRVPDKPAIIAEGRSYTYAQVDEISDRIAAYLMNQGIGRGNVVSVLIPRGEYMLIASLGILKAGAAYQPLDPSYPEERLAFMTNDAGAALLIKDRRYSNILSGFTGRILYTDEISALPKADITLPEIQLSDMFVLLYTSGTTGTPKGVMLSHGNLSSFAQMHVYIRELDENSIVSQYASYGFDAHMHELLPAIKMGCTIMVIPEAIRLDLIGIKEFVEENHITHLFMTTQVARQFAVAFKEVKGLKMLDCGGEKLVSFDPVNTYKITNLYGPSEGTVCCTRFVLDKNYDNIPIGKALPGNRFYVADSYGRRLPVGMPGELIQSGPQVGLGYLGRPDLTPKVFVPNTFEDKGEKYNRCYKTGDIVRFINDGNIEYIGRRDHQVKIRGFRIELGEVEKAIRDYPAVKDATISVIDGGTGGKSLCAYVVSDEKIDVADLGRFISESHPAYMIPAVTLQIDAIPLNVNGKVDKRKLPKPEMHFEDVKKPENELQQQIFDCVADVVGTGEFGIETDIFMAGLSSIGSIRLCTLLADKFDVPVKIRDLKRHNTVTGLEKFIRSAKGLDEENAASGESGGASGQAEDGTAEVKPEYGEPHPITKTMEGIFIECLQRPGSTIYNIPYLMKLGLGIDEARLKKAIVAAVEAHPCMKAELFTDEQGNICQHRRLKDVYSADEIKTIELAGRADINDSLVTPFELTNSRLFEISLIHAEGLYLFINIHHIISDGTSMLVFVRDIEKAYGGEVLQAEKCSAFDAAEEEKASRTKEELKLEKEYYENLLEGTDKDFLPVPDRLADMPEAKGTLSMVQEEADGILIRDFCEKNRLSMNAYFVSVFGTVLARYAGTDYSVFNTIYNGRNDSRLADTVSMLVKTLPVVCRVDKDKVAELLQETSAQLIDSMSNDLYSYAEISRDLGVKNDVMFIFQGDSFVNDSFCGEKAEEITLGLGEAKAPMALQVIIREGKIHYELEYDPASFTENLARAFVQAFDKAAASFAVTENLKDVSLLSAAAEADMERYNATEVPYDKTETIDQLFLEKARLQPEAVCVSYKDKNYSFAQVDDLTAKLSYFLMKQEIGRGDIVAILINRDENMVIGAHGVIRCGAAYLGLDPTYPTDRLEFMIKDSGAGYLIADRSLMHLIPGYKGGVIYTDEISGLELPAAEELEKLAGSEQHKPTPEDQAIIIYSSGTTGLPKGSILRHRNIVCFCHNYTSDYEIGIGSRVATYASFGFDGGAMDVFCAPMSGAGLYVIPDEIRLDLSKLEQFFVRNEITNGFMTTQVGCMFIANTKCRSLRYFLVGGERLIPVTGPEWVTLTNGYGPSETMCYVNKFCVKSAVGLQPIGKVANNTKEYIIDKFGNRLPYGACGELCIAGGQVGKGYLNRPEKTAEAFAPNPFCKDPEYAVMYRTGDVVRMLPDGNYDFVGRRDGQVKIRGFRIELGEIEQQIRKYPGVTKAVVKAFDNPSGGKYLAGYVVMAEKMDSEAIKNFIASEKPDYMVPAVLMQLEDIPLTSNGKVDMRKLPKPELGALRKGAEPANETEEKLCTIFGEVVGIDKVYADDDFFKIGGSSISAIQAVVKCEQAGFPVVYKNLFANPTPQRLAEFLTIGEVKSITAADTNKDGEFDYSALKYNVISNLPNIRNDGVGDVLLTGATGFLGSHVFRELMDGTPGKVICLIRSKEGQSAQTRLETMMTYYFEDWFTDEIKQRVTVIDGELEDEGIREKLADMHFDTIINCAANVKHFAVEGDLMGANFSGVENLVELAEESGAKLIHISSISVSGESVNGSVPAGTVFTEATLNIGQSLENQYIYTKYLGEQAVIDAVSRGRIRGKIIRLGNLMARANDSLFQVNAGQNGMLRMYLGFVKLGCFPVNMLDAELEFSPIDQVARAVVLLSGTPDEFTVFHARNCNSIHYGYLLKALMEAGYPIDVVEDQVFEERLQAALKAEGDVTELGGLLAYRNSIDNTVIDATEHSEGENVNAESAKRVKISTSEMFTTKALYRLGFGWPLISMEYLREMVKTLMEFDFFEG